jgi:hypothetical protein
MATTNSLNNFTSSLTINDYTMPAADGTANQRTTSYVCITTGGLMTYGSGGDVLQVETNANSI